MKIILYYKNIDKILEISDDKVLDELYYNLAMIPTIKQIKEYNNGIIDKKKFIKEEREIISKLSYKVPLFDYITKNIYLVEKNEVYNKVTGDNYRFLDEKIIKLLKETINKIKTIKTKTEWINKYIEKLNKNINFINNFNIKVLKKTFLAIFFETNPTSKEITECIKPTFLPYQYYQSPYYNKSELISLALNLNIIKNTNILPSSYSESEINNIYNKIKKYEIDTQILIYNQLYILYNNAKSYVQYYTLFGSYYFNNYMRNISTKDEELELHINNFLELIKKAPAFKNDYIVYRFIENDEYLTQIKIGDIYNENSFISTTRNPFYSAKNNMFGFILIKIKIPANKEGIALLLESYSNYPHEQEIILPPSTLKLTNIDTNYNYYHWDKLAESKITKVYNFEYINPLFYNISHITSKYLINSIQIPILDFYNIEFTGKSPNDKIYNFFNSLPKINLRRTFYTNIGNNKYTFYVYFLTKNKVYNKFFFLQKNQENNPADEIYMTIQNTINGKIELFIEIKTIISVNYYFRFSGHKNNIPDSDLIHWLAGLAKSLNIFTIIIHGNYNSYIHIAENILKFNNLLDDFKTIQEIDNPDSNIINIYTADINTYCTDIIDYIYNHDQRYNNITYIQRKIPLHMINKLKNIKFKNLYEKYSNKYERIEELNYIYNKGDLDISIMEFYKIIHSKYPYLINKLQNIILNLYPKEFELPWHFYYIFKPFEYLYQKKIIPYITSQYTDPIDDLIKNLRNETLFIHDNKFRQIMLIE